MIFHITAFFVALLASAHEALADDAPSLRGRDLANYPCGEFAGCYLRNLHTFQEVKLNGQDSYNPDEGSASGWAVRCDTNYPVLGGVQSVVDEIKFFYDGKIQAEYGEPRWMNGDADGEPRWINEVSYLDGCTDKEFRIEGNQWGKNCFSSSFNLEAKGCVKGPPATDSPSVQPAPGPTEAPITGTPTLAPATTGPSAFPTYAPFTFSPTTRPPGQCDDFPFKGDDSRLRSMNGMLNTAAASETDVQEYVRMKGEMPEDDEEPNIEARYDPTSDAFCFNQDYPVPNFRINQMVTMYNDFAFVFNRINSPTTDVSENNNDVTNDRFPGMWLRMCFHDNSIDTTARPFREFVHSNIDPITGKWLAGSRYMITSGADASNLICPEERFHPNQNYDQTASRVLKAMQKWLKPIYPQVSYADLLHVGCQAAVIWLDQETQYNPEPAIQRNPWTFGRKDACHVDRYCGKKYPLCGPTALLPGLEMSAPVLNRWFSTRGMNECLWMSTMWSHTTMDNMASPCPLKELTCTAKRSDVTEFLAGDAASRIHFNTGDVLDYFDLYLKPGTHDPKIPFEDPEQPNCRWEVEGRSKKWPMTVVDCTLGLDNVQRSGEANLANAIKNFHKPGFNTRDIFKCALNMLGGRGNREGGICDTITVPQCQTPNQHSFGGYYGF